MTFMLVKLARRQSGPHTWNVPWRCWALWRETEVVRNFQLALSSRISCMQLLVAQTTTSKFARTSCRCCVVVVVVVVVSRYSDSGNGLNRKSRRRNCCISYDVKKKKKEKKIDRSPPIVRWTNFLMRREKNLHKNFPRDRETVYENGRTIRTWLKSRLR